MKTIIKNKNFGVLGNDCATGGFFSNFFTVLSISMKSEKMNLIPFVSITDSLFNRYDIKTKNDNIWSWWFEQKTPTNVDIVEPVSKTLKYFDQGDGVKLWKRRDLPLALEFFNKHYKVKTNI